MNPDKRQIIDVLDRYNAGTNASDAAMLAGLYTEDAVLLPGDMPMASGRSTIEAFYAGAFSQLQIEITFDIDPDAIVVNGDAAVAATRSSGVRHLRATGETVPEDNRELWAFAKQQGQWRISRYMFNKSDAQRARLGPAGEPTANRDLLDRAMRALFGDRDPDAVRSLYTEDYIQHNPGVPTGRAPILGLLGILDEAGFDYTVHRVLEDGDLLLTHTTYRNAEVFGAPVVVAFDLWRVEDGRIAEHWDCITPLATDSVSGRSQVGGSTHLLDRDRTAENKALVEGFVQDVLIGEDWSAVDRYVANGRYAQHNPLVGDGIPALRNAVGALKMKRIHRIVGEGNFVLTQSEGLNDGTPYAFYDLFRVADQKIVEHWDVLQEIPATLAHDNTMF
ncbi:MAG: SgcJ/EcaC family oxidoreductase [Myxococcota bacterium]